MTTKNNDTGAPTHEPSSTLKSAQPMIEMLHSHDPTLVNMAINTLLSVIDYFWYEVCPRSIDRLQSMLVDGSGGDGREVVALLLSKIHYHMGVKREALEYALMAGTLFTEMLRGEGVDEDYVQTIINHALDTYNNSDDGSSAALQTLVESIIEAANSRGEHKQAVGMSLECKRLDLFTASLQSGAQGGRVESILAYALECIESLGAEAGRGHLSKHNAIIACINVASEHIEATSSSSSSNTSSLELFILDCYVKGRDSDGWCKYFLGIFDAYTRNTSSERRQLLLQAAFNTVYTTVPSFVAPVLAHLALAGEAGSVESQLKAIFTGKASQSLHLQSTQHQSSAAAREQQKDLIQILETTKASLRPSQSMHHAAISCSFAFTHARTGNDSFLRNNQEWLGVAMNWSKWMAAGSLGLVHCGRSESDAMTILSPYLPTDLERSLKDRADSKGTAAVSSPYSEGGAMFALGMINLQRGFSPALLETYTKYICSNGSEDGTDDSARGDSNMAALTSGAVLGIGCAQLGSKFAETLSHLQNILWADEAITAESAAISIGLLFMGGGGGSSAEGAAVVDELIAFAGESVHDRVQRAIGMSIALMHAGTNHGSSNCPSALATANKLLASPNPFLRYGGVWTLALSHPHTSQTHPSVASQLLSLSTHDCSVDVRRAASSALGLVFLGDAEGLLSVCEQLIVGYCEHVRYGAVMALGLCLSGSASQDAHSNGAAKNSARERAIALLTPLHKDFSEIVRQAALISLSLIHHQTPNDKVTQDHRRLLSTLISPSSATSKHSYYSASSFTPQLSLFGAIIAQGIVDVGGRQSVISLLSAGTAGSVDVKACVGAVLFLQYWYWYPMMFMLNLAIKPSSLLIVDCSPPTGNGSEFRVPMVEATCSCPPDLFTPPPPERKQTGKVPTKLVHAILSTATSNNNKNLDNKDGAAMQVDPPHQEKQKDQKEEEKAKVKEATEHKIQNMQRLCPDQRILLNIPAAIADCALSRNTANVIVIDAAKAGISEFIDVDCVDAVKAVVVDDDVVIEEIIDDGDTDENAEAMKVDGDNDKDDGDAEVKPPAPFTKPDYI